MSDAIEAVLRGAGLTDKPGEHDSSIHSWRCGHPQTYGPCDCFQELVRELAEVERAAAEKAWWAAESAFGQAHDQDHLDPWSHMPVNPYRAATLGLTAGQEGEEE